MEILDRIVNQDEEELHKVKTIPLPTRLFEMTIREFLKKLFKIRHSKFTQKIY